MNLLRCSCCHHQMTSSAVQFHAVRPFQTIADVEGESARIFIDLDVIAQVRTDDGAIVIGLLNTADQTAIQVEAPARAFGVVVKRSTVLADLRHLAHIRVLGQALLHRRQLAGCHPCGQHGGILCNDHGPRARCRRNRMEWLPVPRLRRRIRRSTPPETSGRHLAGRAFGAVYPAWALPLPILCVAAESRDAIMERTRLRISRSPGQCDHGICREARYRLPGRTCADAASRSRPALVKTAA